MQRWANGIHSRVGATFLSCCMTRRSKPEMDGRILDQDHPTGRLRTGSSLPASSGHWRARSGTEEMKESRLPDLNRAPADNGWIPEYRQPTTVSRSNQTELSRGFRTLLQVPYLKFCSSSFAIPASQRILIKGAIFKYAPEHIIETSDRRGLSDLLGLQVRGWKTTSWRR